MFKSIKNYKVVTPALVAVAIAGNAVSANANDADSALNQISEYNKTQPMGQITSVSQLRDVSPTDWAYEALRSLVERYGCIVGYPDRTYRGNRALSRFEFAAGLNACLQQIERLIAANEAVIREDIEKLQRLMKEFETELAALGARVDNLEGRVAFLEDHQFSTTTKLRGEVIFAATGFGPRDDGNDQFTLSDRVRLTLNTSFTGKDNLRLRLAAGNVPKIEPQGGGGQARLNFEQNTPDNNVLIDRAFYTSPLGSNARFWVGTAIGPDDIYDSYSPFTESSGGGSLARASRYNPNIYRTTEGGGAAFKYSFSKAFDITASYLAGNPADPREGNGLFNGQYAAAVQLGFRPADSFRFGVSYAYDYLGTPVGGMANVDTRFNKNASHNVGVQGTWRISKNVNLAAWYGWTSVTDPSRDNSEATYNNFNATFSFIDLGKEGAVLNIGGGMLPSATRVQRPNGLSVNSIDQSWIIEGNYKYPVTKNISITPGVYAIFNPNGGTGPNDDTVVVGVLRTVFSF